MPTNLKRKGSLVEEDTSRKVRRRSEELASEEALLGAPLEESATEGTESEYTSGPSASTSKPVDDRRERFRALQARQAESKQENRKETANEEKRRTTDVNLLHTLDRKKAIYSQKLQRSDADAAGEDYERKRAWDWTIEESEKWDRREGKKEKHRQDVAFQDYRQAARKAYKKKMRDFKPDIEAYQKEKAESLQRAAESGGLEVFENEDGELVAVDKDGAFYATANSTDFASNKPDRAAVDRLVADLKKDEEAAMRKSRTRHGDDDSDVTYINDKNKQFNMKLKRFYDKYTTEIRDSFERGTAI